MRTLSLNPSTLATLSLAAFASLSGCAPKKASVPVVTDAHVVRAEAAPRSEIPKEPQMNVVAAPVPGEISLRGTEADRIVAEVSLNKAAILGKTFLYGSDLQYSAMNDAKYELVLQSMALGHLPVKFKIVGKNLQLIADQSSKFESDVNHPGLLVHEFPIVSETDENVTISMSRGSPLLASTVAEAADTPAAKQSWLRSLKYVSEGNYLMFETSIQAADGSVFEFMESVFPRENLVPADAKTLLADSVLEPLAERFRFLGAGKVFMDLPNVGRVQTEAASRFHLQGDKTVDWYVTPNVPEEYLPELRAGVEGWNRYSQAMWSRDMLSFKGKLPEGVKLGDPRFNVINWGNVAMAGAAYESQASDTLTGIQSHSLIYLPLAWVNIGKEYWARGELSDVQQNAPQILAKMMSHRSFAGKPLSVDCLADPSMKISIEARQNPESFAKELLKGVLFHEMGHALGLAHNFKGSLSWDFEKPEAIFSTSIMDYNQYQIERAAYESVDSIKGPLLEYDRQILSVLYNEGKDVKDTDAVLPACNDEETDSVAGGVDPLCIRYDSGKDPTQALASTIRLVIEADFKMAGAQSLPMALAQAAGDLGDASSVNLEKATEKVEALAKQALGLVNFYVATGANSINYMTRANLRSLQVFTPGSLPETYDETQMRARALKALQFVAGMDELPPAPATALTALEASAQAWVLTVPSLSADQLTTLQKQVTKSFSDANEKISTGPKSLLMQVRTRVLGSLARVSSAPFRMINGPEGRMDFEAITLSLLEWQINAPVRGKVRELAERAAYANSLMTYADTDEGKAAIVRVRAKIGEELSASKDETARENARKLLKTLKI